MFSLFSFFKVAPGTDKESIVCYCTHLTSFGSDLLVAPNPIDFDSVFQNFGSLAENVAVLVLISTIIGAYILGVIWARRADKKDLLMVIVNQIPRGFTKKFFFDIIHYCHNTCLVTNEND